VVQLEKYFDFSLYSHHFSLLSLTSLLSEPEREVTSPSDFKVVGALKEYSFHYNSINKHGCHRRFLFLIGLFLKNILNQKQELSVVAMIFNGSGQNEQSL
jgi:hypothetical protein